MRSLFPILRKIVPNLSFVSLIFGLTKVTEQFEIVCLPEKLLAAIQKNLMCRFVRVLNIHFRAVYRAKYNFM